MFVAVRDNNVDQALRVLKKKMQREGLFREMKILVTGFKGFIGGQLFKYFGDIGYEVDYSKVESSYLLEMSENTNISNDPNSSDYDQITYQKKRRQCPHCNSSHTDEIKDTILPDRTSE